MTVQFYFDDLVNNKVPLYWKRGDMTAAQAFDQLYKDEPPFQISDFGDITKFKTRLSSLRKIVILNRRVNKRKKMP
jgi:hypothetical protein